MGHKTQLASMKKKDSNFAELIVEKEFSTFEDLPKIEYMSEEEKGCLYYVNSGDYTMGYGHTCGSFRGYYNPVQFEDGTWKWMYQGTVLNIIYQRMLFGG